MGKTLSSVKLNDTLTLSECTDGFWLYDEVAGMNLGMRAKTQQDAFVQCISYYQRRLTEVETKHAEMSVKVETFVNQFPDMFDLPFEEN